MTEPSLVPKLAAHDGPTFEELVAMDVRGRLVQSLKLKLKRRAKAAPRLRAHARPLSDSRVLRFVRRWGDPLLELKVPRGAGASAAALLLLASTYYGVVKGGHGPVIAAQIQDICDAAANRMGFHISEIALSGEHEVSREDILGQFLIEALLLSILGGIAGIALGFGGATLTGDVFTDLPAPVVTGFAVLIAAGVALVIGVGAGLYPAVRASLLQPVEAVHRQ